MSSQAQGQPVGTQKWRPGPCQLRRVGGNGALCPSCATDVPGPPPRLWAHVHVGKSRRGGHAISRETGTMVRRWDGQGPGSREQTIAQRHFPNPGHSQTRPRKQLNFAACCCWRRTIQAQISSRSAAIPELGSPTALRRRTNLYGQGVGRLGSGAPANLRRTLKACTRAWLVDDGTIGRRKGGSLDRLCLDDCLGGWPDGLARLKVYRGGWGCATGE